MNKKIHVIPHTHWDREWYFTTSRSKVYLMEDFGRVLATLENDPDYKYYMLDGQASLLDDYLAWMPQDFERITTLVKSGRLKVGPWYTQSDQLVISGESIVRNLYYGIESCQEFGGYMNVGYVPDSFGQAGNMPQIYRDFGIEDTLFWRGVSDDMVKHTDFNWKGDDGSTVFATQIPFGYYIGGNIPEGEGIDEFWQKECFEKAGKRSATNNIYFPNGFDQAPIRTNLPELLKQRNQVDQENEYVISCIEDYIKDVKAQNPELEEVTGELVIAKHMRIHKSIFSSRSDLKVLNTKVQNYVSNVLEPILTMSYSLKNPYPHGAVSQIWKLLFENAAHDSIGSCISDQANEDVYLRYKQAGDIATNLVELHSRLIATKINSNEDQMTFTIINPLPQSRSEIVKVKAYVPGGKFAIKDEQGNPVAYTILERKDLTDYVMTQTIRLNPSKEIYLPERVDEVVLAFETRDIPAMGYVQYSLEVDRDTSQELKETDKLENEYYEITVESDGSLTIYDKIAGYEYKNQAILVENGDDGDSFNYSPPRHDLEVYSTASPFSFKIEGSPILQEAKIDFVMDVPADLEERAMGKTSVKLPVTMTVGLKKGSKVIDLKVKVANAGLSHRLCVMFDSHLATKFNYADQQFGSIKRPNYYEKEMALYFQEENKEVKETKSFVQLANWANDQSSWQEPPISIEPTQSYVALTDQSRGIAVFPQGVREYEIVNEQGSQIRLTLFRTYGYMGKENLVYRPGRASGEKIIATPDAQLLKEMEFDFGFTTFVGTLNDANIDTMAKSYNSEMEVYPYAEFLNGRLIFSQTEIEGNEPNSYSLMKTNGNLVVSAIKKAEKEQGYLIRLYNGKDHQELDDVIRFNTPITQAWYTNLKEEKVEAIPVENNEITISNLGHCKFVTILVK